MSDEYVIWFLLIFASDLAAAAIWSLASLGVNAWKKKLIENVKCDICGQPRKTYKTFDKRYYACRKCRKIYNTENKPSKAVVTNVS